MEQSECIRSKDAKGIRLRDVLKIKYVKFVFLLYFLIFLGFSFFYTAFPLHALRSLEWSIRGIGTFFGVLSLMMVVVQGPVLKRVSKLASEAVLIIAGNVILGTSFVLLTSADTVLIYLAAVLFAVGNGIMWPSVLSILSRVAGERYQGSVQGFAGGVGSLASVIGLITGGLLYESAGAGTFFVSATTIYVAAVLSLRLLRLAPGGSGA